ncbi:MAG: hypothetical protein KGQ60_08825, partial [Planctomycetes bacterium]|nr:hypothetical protein [Planctomycetota bacterium]
GVAIGALLLCWLANLLCCSVLSEDLLQWNDESARVALLVFMNSFFLVLVSFVSAWVFPSSTIALLAIIPMACLPVFFLYLQTLFFEESFYQTLGSTIFSLVAASLFFACLGGFYARNTIVARPSKFMMALPIPPRVERNASPSWLLDTQPRSTTLLWQVIKQNWLITIFGIAVLLIPLLSSLKRVPSEPRAVLGLIVYGLLLAALGASIFGYDAARQRIRFLADRGVDPGKVWWSRQITPFAFLGLFVFFASFSLRFFPELNLSVGFVSIGCLLMIYFATQWSSQWFVSSILNVCAAPAVGGCAVCLSIFAGVAFRAGIVQFVIASFLMLLATRTMMRPWMDGRFGFRYGLGHASFGAAIALVLSIHWFAALFAYPKLSPAVRAEMTQTISSPKTSLSGSSLNLHPASPPGVPSGIPGMVYPDQDADLTMDPSQTERTETPNSDGKLTDWNMQRDRYYDAIEEQLDRHSGPSHDSLDVLRFLTNDASLARLNAKQTEPADQEKLRYSRALKIAHTLVARLRLSPFLMEQDLADRLEFWMTGECQIRETKDWLGKESYKSIAQGLANRAARNEARKRAIANSWNRSIQESSSQGFFVASSGIGGFWMPLDERYGTLSQSMLARRRIDVAAQLLWEQLQAPEDQRAKAIEKLHTFWTVEGPATAVSPSPDLFFANLPGQYWNQNWEHEAERLVEDL